MNQEQFEAVLENRLAATRTILANKAKEYATDDDRLHNFNVGAAMQGIPREQVCWNFLMKHLISLQDMVKEPEKPSLETWREKTGDAINYLVLLEAIVTNRLGLKAVVAERLCEWDSPSPVGIPPSVPPPILEGDPFSGRQIKTTGAISFPHEWMLE